VVRSLVARVLQGWWRWFVFIDAFVAVYLFASSLHVILTGNLPIALLALANMLGHYAILAPYVVGFAAILAVMTVCVPLEQRPHRLYLLALGPIVAACSAFIVTTHTTYNLF